MLHPSPVGLYCRGSAGTSGWQFGGRVGRVGALTSHPAIPAMPPTRSNRGPHHPPPTGAVRSETGAAESGAATQISQTVTAKLRRKRFPQTASADSARLSKMRASAPGCVPGNRHSGFDAARDCVEPHAVEIRIRHDESEALKRLGLAVLTAISDASRAAPVSGQEKRGGIARETGLPARQAARQQL